MGHYGRALQLLYTLAAGGCLLEWADGAIELDGEPTQALDALLGQFVAVDPLPDGPELAALAADLTRSTAPGRRDGEALQRVGAPVAPDGVEALQRAGRDGQAAYRALAALVRAPDVMTCELHALPCAHLRLPVPYAVAFARKGVRALFTTSQSIYRRELGRMPLFVLRELDVMALAYEQGRASPGQLDQWLAAKARGGEWVLTAEHAGLLPIPMGSHPDPPACELGELFDEYGAELVGVEMQEAA